MHDIKMFYDLLDLYTNNHKTVFSNHKVKTISFIWIWNIHLICNLTRDVNILFCTYLHCLNCLKSLTIQLKVSKDNIVF